MGFKDIVMNYFNRDKVVSTGFQLVVDNGNGFYSFGNKIYKSDIVRSAIRPKARAIGKAIPKHIRDDGTKQVLFPDNSIKFLLSEPNPIMNWQQLVEKLITQLELNGNAFALIIKDRAGNPLQEFPIVATKVEVIQNSQKDLFYRFFMSDGKTYIFKFEDVIHLRKDFNSNEYFGDNPLNTLLPLMEVVSVVDQGIIQAVKNSNVIRWLLKFNSVTRPEKIKEQTKEFVDSFLRTESTVTGAAGIDSSVDAKQVEPKNYIPDNKQIDLTIERILSFFNTNKKIIQSSYSENEWISYYESNCEPDLKQLSNEHTRKLFTKRQRGFGNYIYIDASDLSFASMKTKLNLVQLVDREIMSVEEIREVFKLGPKDENHTFVRRLDTARISEVEEEGGD